MPDLALSPLRTQLQRDEGLRLFVYEDTKGIPTIGYGRNLAEVGVSSDEASYLLDNDIERTKAAVSKALPWSDSLDDARRGVLVNMSFNMGIGGLEGFHGMLAKLEVGDFEGAAMEMEDSKWAGEVGARAQRLIMQMRTGVWQ